MTDRARFDSRQQDSRDTSWLALGTVVRLKLVTDQPEPVAADAVMRATDAIQAVERACSRFDPDSELVQVMRTAVGRAVSVGPILFQAVKFALEVANWTQGQFDPTIGSRMEELGFRNHYLTQETIHAIPDAAPEATYRDVELDEESQTVRLHRPMKLDLGAVAKGLAVDLAVHELKQFQFDGFVIDAGGDLYVAGLDERHEKWKVGIRHPTRHLENIMTLCVSDAAVCTSGTYERPSPVDEGSHHLIDAHTKQSAGGLLSVTAVGPYTMMVDALSTAAFVAGSNDALSVLEQSGMDGVVVTDDLNCKMTPGMERYLI